MRIEGTATIRAPRDIVWDLLIDPNVIARCIPGCQKLEPQGDNRYAATLVVGVAAIRGTYEGTFTLSDLQPPGSYRIAFDGKGTQGFVAGTGTLTLQQQDEHTTVHYAGDIRIGGTLAAVGQRMLQSAARMMAGQFFTAIEAEAEAALKARETGRAAPSVRHGIVLTLLRSLRNLVRNVLRRAFKR
ncbi:MAG TPA: carbon monoxide dehydrogenase subunit G [Blastocatellia bacterium]|nr:carbon monoxide dehydrogenase subunit G [Blastocatellia bacterium]